MKIPAALSARATVCAALASLLTLGAHALWAQTAPPTNYSTAPAQGNSLASLNEDVQILSREVNRLRLDLETLRQTNENLQKQILSQRDIASQIQNAIAAAKADNRADLAAARKDITDGVARQIEDLAKKTDEQLKKLAKAIQDMQPRGSGSSGTGTPGPARVIDKNFPKTGINYTVKKGDALSTIARQNNSTIDWILSANADTIKSADDVPAGAVIFIPQKPATDSPSNN